MPRGPVALGLRGGPPPDTLSGGRVWLFRSPRLTSGHSCPCGSWSSAEVPRSPFRLLSKSFWKRCAAMPSSTSFVGVKIHLDARIDWGNVVLGNLCQDLRLLVSLAPVLNLSRGACRHFLFTFKIANLDNIRFY